MKTFFLAASLLISSHAFAQVPCGSLDTMHESLVDQHQEVLFAVGNLTSGEPFRMYVGPQTKTFTLLFSPLDAPELGCVLQSGVNFGPAIEKRNAI
jgi:hypothetical protein